MYDYASSNDLAYAQLKMCLAKKPPTMSVIKQHIEPK